VTEMHVLDPQDMHVQKGRGSFLVWFSRFCDMLLLTFSLVFEDKTP
jgi:hypothetical protein